ncbi:hypothetical protein AB1Y20_003436 [Prymnesium parvum]|uniref:Myotubularin phosphatase domain-containing protein n=1 Tax=Prymnesium parvum TaxID=97485 RepID=A0AB34JC89_PRYPA
MSSAELLASLGVTSSHRKAREKASEVVDLFPGLDPLSVNAIAPDAVALPVVRASDPKPSTQEMWPEIPPPAPQELDGPLSFAVPEASDSDPAAGLSRTDAELDLPEMTQLFTGETLVSRPTEGRRRVGEGAESGRIFVTTGRVIWESSPDTPTSSAKGGSVVELPLHAVDRLKKQKGGTGSSTLRELEEQSFPGADDSPRSAASSSKLRSLVTRSGRSGAMIEAEVYLKYGAWPALQLQLEEAAFVRLSQVLASATLNAPSKYSDLRADIRRTLAVASAASPREASSTRGSSEGCARASHAMWALYDAEAEFHRQGLQNPLSHWRISLLNEKYELCSTYPRLLVVPRKVTDHDLLQAAKFRSGGRLPVLCWKDPFGVASICRSSQPCVGVAKARSSYDEQLLQAIADTNPVTDRLQIIDCRPRVNAALNHAKGKGYEHSAQYVMAKISFMNIDNIHVMRASLRAFLAALQQRPPTDGAKEEENWQADLDRCGWMEHLRTMLRAATRIAQMVSVERSSVLVHCSDGWDRTPQLTALSQLLLDSTYRSRAGFRTLIEKEWLSFGHQFAMRCATVAPFDKSAHMPSDENVSPIFLQFVDCVWQLSQQFPTAFEFNGTYLATLMDAVLSCKFGDFLCNCERQRVEQKLDKSCHSVWGALEGYDCLNLDYLPSAEHVLIPDIYGCNMRPWTAFYCRGASLQHAEPQPLLEARCAALAQEVADLRVQLQKAQLPGMAGGTTDN